MVYSDEVPIQISIIHITIWNTERIYIIVFDMAHN